MTSLRLADDGNTVVAAEDATPHLFDLPARGGRYRLRGWPYVASVVFHVIAIVSIVAVARALIHTTPRPTVSRRDRMVAHAFVFGGFHESTRPRAVRKTARSADVPVVIAGDPIPLPPARGDARESRMN